MIDGQDGWGWGFKEAGEVEGRGGGRHGVGGGRRGG